MPQIVRPLAGREAGPICFEAGQAGLGAMSAVRLRSRAEAVERVLSAGAGGRVHFGSILKLTSKATESLKAFTRIGPCPDCFWIFGLKRHNLSSARICRTDKRIPPRVEVKGSGVFPGSMGAAWTKLDRFFDDHLESAK